MCNRNAKEILNFYGLKASNYKVVKFEANNIKVRNKKTHKVIDLRY